MKGEEGGEEGGVGGKGWGGSWSWRIDLSWRFFAT